VKPNPGAVRGALALGLTALVLSSCSYFNTFYLARKYYFRATAGAPYPVDGGASASTPNFSKSIDYSKKLLAQYPKSKYVDDAYLLWARALLGKDDPMQTVSMLQDFGTRFPKSSLQAEAMFYLGVAYRQARRYADAVSALDEFLRRAPRHAMAPYAHLERSRALTALNHPVEAAAAAGEVLERFPKSDLADRARAARAEAYLAGGRFDLARADFQVMGTRSQTDEERFGFLLREADCLEAARDFPAELALLEDALSHEREPLPPDTTGGRFAAAPTGVGADRWGRLTLRVGGAQMLAGRLEESLAAYRQVVADYPKTQLAAEAQFRVGFAYETVGDDFERARAEYARVKDQSAAGPFITQATQRLANLDRLAQFRGVSGDTLQKLAEAGLLRAELYLFQLDKPERALEEYRKTADALKGTPWAARALNAEGWVLSRKLDRAAEAESLFWTVVRDYPATEEQLAARDYLEMAGRQVPDSLIKAPPPRPTRADTLQLTRPPSETGAIGTQPRGILASPADSLRLGGRRVPLQVQYAPGSPGAGLGAVFQPAPDSTRAARPDTTRGASKTPPDTSRAVTPPDTSRTVTPPDTTRQAPPADTTRGGR
jgi:TolA-binding protein